MQWKYVSAYLLVSGALFADQEMPSPKDLVKPDLKQSNVFYVICYHI